MLIDNCGYVKETPSNGTGLFASQFIPKGKIIARVSNDERFCKKKDINNFSVDLQKDLMVYAYSDKDGYIYYPKDNNKYMNHSCNPNVLDFGDGVEVAIKNIEINEEITCDYRQFYDSDWCANFKCNCNSLNCCGIMKYDLSVTDDVLKFWTNIFMSISPV